ncbi:disease resistance protein (TIR-NBS-LRR class) [Artemisia annua]|uniref:Disease resistance protein (TIR-NBS-LRR class) n=1 Tax=Artemisia annua TaxID=35608 RepID=A0A2U1PZK3_ARTAN|nr:disease resistance protein (TIR-NBS-LRR class) [Artemisia annua]
MASTSTSSFKKSFKYDVFLSFRGEDTRKNFVDHLYYALEQKSIHTYKDDERIKKGKIISDELIRSIEDSKFYIIVFSKSYASSSWCLDELVKIMECQKTSEHAAYPVFYDVEPTEVRKQSGAVGEAFARHEKYEAAGKWRDALTEAADLAGWELKNTADGHEAKFIQKIVEEVSLEMNFTSYVDENLVGMKDRVKDVVSCLEIGLNDVRMIGIKGMGGSGKTTLARALFDHISIEFEAKSFVENVREVSQATLSGLKILQKQVLSAVLNEHVSLDSVHDGKNMMKRRMSGRKVLLVLDDVDHIDQLEALAGKPSWLKPGSRIIITTRDEQVLVAYGVSLIHNVNLLSHEEAVCLFSRYAFGRELPIQGYEELSGKVVSYAAGLPLSIRILGSLLRGKNEIEWKDSIERLKKIPLEETQKVLELSYDSLENDHKKMFLTVACILKGEQKDKAIQVLECCGFHAISGIKVLEQKSLITISRHGDLGMHDHIEEMGRNIVRRFHLDEYKRHSHLWIAEEIEDILANNLGNEAIKYIRLSPLTLNLETVMKGLRNMKKLRVLYMCSLPNWKESKVSQHFPDGLRYLCWRAYPFSSLHETFQADNLVGLDMSFSSIELWNGPKEKVLNKLRFLDISYTPLRRLNLGLTPNLEVLNLEQCRDLIELHIHDECPNLKYLGVDHSSLRKLYLGLTLNLETLSLVGCCDLIELHIPNGCPKLKSLSLDKLNLRKLYLGPNQVLETLSLVACTDLEELRMPFRCPKLKSLNLNCSRLKTLDLGQTSDLETISLRGCELVDFHMPEECPTLRSIDLSHSKLRTLDFGLTPKLERLDLKDCLYLEEINGPIGCLKKLVYLELSGCERLKYFMFDKLSKSVELDSLSELHLIARHTVCSLHSENKQVFQFTCLSEEYLPPLFRNLDKVISMGLCACRNLENLSKTVCSLQFLRKLVLEGYIPVAPEDLNRLEYLEELMLSSTTVQHLPDSVCMLKQLKSLKLQDCYNLVKLPKDLGQLESLEELFLSKTNIQSLPDSVCMLKHLKSLKLQDCYNLVKLPEDFGQLESLEELILSDTKFQCLPDSICMLKQLKYLEVRNCSYLEKLPKDIGRLESLEKLTLERCIALRDIPESVSNMKRLKDLSHSDCFKVETLPEELGCLECLENLRTFIFRVVFFVCGS